MRRRRRRAGEDARGQVERQVCTAVFPARRNALPRICAFVEETCERAGVPRRDSLRLTLLLEELFINTVVHGHGCDSEAPVQIALALAPAAIEVEYDDTAGEFDPFATVRAPSEADVDDRPVGGLGITLITTMAEELRYTRRAGHNEIRFCLRLSS